MNTKPFYYSKTILGVIVSAVVYIAGLCGWHIADLAPQILDAISKQIDATITIAGLVFAVYGRVTAKTQVTLGPTPSPGKTGLLLALLVPGVAASVSLSGCAGQGSTSSTGSTTASTTTQQQILAGLSDAGVIGGDLLTDLLQGAITYNDAQAALKGTQQSMNGHGVSVNNIGQYALAASNAANTSGVLTAAQQLQKDIAAQIAAGIPTSQIESQVTAAQVLLPVTPAPASTGTATPTGTTTP
jgi:hypothetical protein